MNILIIGLGSIAHKHIKAINLGYPDASIYALRTSRNAEQVEQVHNIYSLNELDKKPDFIIISNPTQMHEETIRTCLPIGSPLFIEKPVFSDLQHAGIILDEIAKKNIQTYVACNLRFHPVVRFLKTYLSENKPRINEVNIYCGSYLPDWRPGKDFRKIYSANADMGGGVHLDLIHELDYCTWLFGIPDHVTSLKRNVSSLAITASDYAHYVLSYPEFTSSVTLNYYRRDPKRTIEIVFEDKTWVADLISCQVTDHKGEIIFQKKDFHIQQTYEAQLEYFINGLKNSTPLMNNINEASAVLKMILNN